MTLKQFSHKLVKIIEDSGEFAVWDYRDKSFSHMDIGEITVVGESEADTFAFQIIKVKI